MCFLSHYSGFWASSRVSPFPICVTLEKLTNHLSLGFLICKMRIIIVLYHRTVVRIKWGNPCKALSTMPCTYKPSINISCCFSLILLSWIGILRTHLYWSRDLGNLFGKRQQANHLITGEKLAGHCLHCSLPQITYQETLTKSLSFSTLILCEKCTYSLRLEKIDSMRMRSKDKVKSSRKAMIRYYWVWAFIQRNPLWISKI